MTGAPLGVPAGLPVARGVAAVPVEVALAFQENPKAPIISPFFIKKKKTFDDANLAALAPLLHRHPADLLPPPLRRPKKLPKKFIQKIMISF